MAEKYVVYIPKNPKLRRYKRIVSEALLMLFPVDIRFCRDKIIKDYFLWAINAAKNVPGINITKKYIYDLTNAVKTLAGLKLKKYICNFILSSEGMSQSRFDYVPY